MLLGGHTFASADIPGPAIAVARAVVIVTSGHGVTFGNDHRGSVRRARPPIGWREVATFGGIDMVVEATSITFGAGQLVAVGQVACRGQRADPHPAEDTRRGRADANQASHARSIVTARAPTC